MVNIIENRAAIEGVIRSFSMAGAPAGHLQVEVDLHKTSEVGGFPNLAKADEGNTIMINIRQGQLPEASLQAGCTLQGNVRKAFGQVYFMQE